MSAIGHEPARRSKAAPAPAFRSTRSGAAAGLCLLGLLWSCGGAGPSRSTAHEGNAARESPLVAMQPGAWFDSQGNLAIVGAGRRLRLILSAPISACPPAFQVSGAPPEVSSNASLPFHVLSEVCRTAHPAILLAEESETASPTELEQSYREVAHCAANDWDLTEGWVPKVIEDSDPCPLALGLGWRLPSVEEVQGLTLDDRKAAAGALFDTEDRTASAGLLLYARGTDGLKLMTLSPNAAEQPPALTDQKRGRSLFGAALRCTRSPTDGADTKAHTSWPVLPHAVDCLHAQRQAQGATPERSTTTAEPGVEKLRDWIDEAKRSPKFLRSDASLRDLSRLLASPALEQLARDARDERALTEHYSELAEGLDDPAVSAGERERRHAEFDKLRQRLADELVHEAEGGADRTQLAALLSHLQFMLEDASIHGKPGKPGAIDYRLILARVRELGGGKAIAR